MVWRCSVQCYRPTRMPLPPSILCWSNHYPSLRPTSTGPTCLATTTGHSSRYASSHHQCTQCFSVNHSEWCDASWCLMQCVFTVRYSMQLRTYQFMCVCCASLVTAPQSGLYEPMILDLGRDFVTTAISEVPSTANPAEVPVLLRAALLRAADAFASLQKGGEKRGPDCFMTK